MQPPHRTLHHAAKENIRSCCASPTHNAALRSTGGPPWQDWVRDRGKILAIRLVELPVDSSGQPRTEADWRCDLKHSSLTDYGPGCEWGADHKFTGWIEPMRTIYTVGL